MNNKLKGKAKFKNIQYVKMLTPILIIVGHILSVSYQNGVLMEDILVNISRTGGVDVFFVLSGFMIYSLYKKRIKQNYESIFIKKRVYRIYPLVWIFTLASLPVYFIAPGFGSGHETEMQTILKSLLLFPQDEPVLGATWSLSHVVLFYIWFVFLLRYTKSTLIIIGIWIVTTLANISFGFVNESSILLSFLLSPYNLEFIFGALIAEISIRFKIKRPKILIYAGLLLFMYNWLGFIDGLIIYPTLTYSIGAGLIILGSIILDKEKPRPVNKIVDLVADSSYAVIITNLPIIILLVKLMDKLGLFSVVNNFILFIVIGIMATIGGIVVHKLIEEPVHKALTKKISYKQKSAVA
nr:acyltransferase [Terribacillus saccharophilus]